MSHEREGIDREKKKRERVRERERERERGDSERDGRRGREKSVTDRKGERAVFLLMSLAFPLFDQIAVSLFVYPIKR